MAFPNEMFNAENVDTNFTDSHGLKDCRDGSAWLNSCAFMESVSKTVRHDFGANLRPARYATNATAKPMNHA
jgi:hypothetical protein